MSVPTDKSPFQCLYQGVAAGALVAVATLTGFAGATPLVVAGAFASATGVSRRSISETGTTNSLLQTVDSLTSLVLSDTIVPASRSPLRRCKMTFCARTELPRMSAASISARQIRSGFRRRRVIRQGHGFRWRQAVGGNAPAPAAHPHPSRPIPFHTPPRI